MSIHELGLYFVYVRTTDGNRMSYHGHAYHALYGLKISDIPKALLSNRSGLAATHVSRHELHMFHHVHTDLLGAKNRTLR